jgi:hypothetical protein
MYVAQHLRSCVGKGAEFSCSAVEIYWTRTFLFPHMFLVRWSAPKSDRACLAEFSLPSVRVLTGTFEAPLVTWPIMNAMAQKREEKWVGGVMGHLCSTCVLWAHFFTGRLRLTLYVACGVVQVQGKLC